MEKAMEIKKISKETIVQAQAKRILQQQQELRRLQAVHILDVQKTTIGTAFKFLIKVILKKFYA
jgi:hypothetical protein